MLQIGDYVVSSSNGICKIEEETWQDWSGEKTLYFVLIPINEKGSKVYIPVKTAEQRVRKAMTESEAWQLISNLKLLPDIVIENQKFCEKEYKTAIYSGDPVMVARAIKTIYSRMRVRTSSGKKATAIDERYFKTAIHILHSELSYALGCKEDEVESKILEAIQ